MLNLQLQFSFYTEIWKYHHICENIAMQNLELYFVFALYENISTIFVKKKSMQSTPLQSDFCNVP